jgi:hypothetical protein
VGAFILHPSRRILCQLEFAPVKRLGVVFLLLAAACGKRGDPRPPVPIIPQATSDLVVTQRANDIMLSWSYPSLTTTGQSLTRLRRIVVYRYSEPLPPSVSTRPTDPPEPGVPEAVAQFAKVPELTPVQFGRLSERVESMEGANLKDATVGARIIFRDSPQMRTIEGRPMRLTYAIVSEGENARSPLSNLVTIVPLPVAVPPTEVTATPNAGGVLLSWKAPQTSIAGGTAPIVSGYNVYRGEGENVGRAFDSPVNETLIRETTWTDVPSYGEHTYRVTAVATNGPPRIESEPSAQVKATFKDLVPPPPPASVSALVETNAVRLIWDAVDAPDLAGYRIQRAEGTGLETLREVGKFPLTALTQETTYLDTTVQIGISFRYEVTALDKNGNESAPVSTGWVLVPRTP